MYDEIKSKMWRFMKLRPFFFFAMPTTSTHNETQFRPFCMKFQFEMHYIQLYIQQPSNNWCWFLTTVPNSIEKIFSFIFHIFLLLLTSPEFRIPSLNVHMRNVIGLRAACANNRINGVHLRFSTSNITCCGMPFFVFFFVISIFDIRHTTYLWKESHKMDLLSFYFLPNSALVDDDFRWRFCR